MSEVVLRVEKLSKQYRLGEVGTGTISHDLNRWWANIRGKEDPYSKVGQVNDRTKEASSDYVQVLNDINFEVKRGEILGVIGKNGAGKSTLLKLISRITAPTLGSIKAKGRIASLLEVGTGMNPEMTARENIYLNGTILGMTKQEISSKFDEIVDFSGCSMFVDTPVKRFSSGMRVRLGFAVAAFLEPEILIVDEVLAVGDAEFQNKAIGKMKEVSSSGGRTVLFVSHNLASISALCTRCLLLDKGKVISDDTTANVLEKYRKISSSSESGIEVSSSSKEIYVKKAFLKSNDSGFLSNQKIEIRIDVGSNVKFNNRQYVLVRLLDSNESVITSVEKLLKEESKEMNLLISENLLTKGCYKINIIIYQPGVAQYDNVNTCCDFEILENKSNFSHLETFDIGKVYTNISLQ